LIVITPLTPLTPLLKGPTVKFIIQDLQKDKLFSHGYLGVAPYRQSSLSVLFDKVQFSVINLRKPAHQPGKEVIYFITYTIISFYQVILIENGIIVNILESR